MTLPQKRIRPKSGISRGARREFPRHRAFVRKHNCSTPHCIGLPIEFAHIRTAANSGVGLKPHDAFGISWCRACHSEAHQVGHETFAKQHKMNLFALAKEFALRSPCEEVREFARGMSER